MSVDDEDQPWNAERMKKILLQWVIIAASLALVDYLFDGVRFRSPITLFVSALVLGFVNALVRPVLTFLTLPVTILTLGLFYLVVNGLAFALAAFFVPGFEVAGFGTAVGAALITSIVSTVLEGLFQHRD
jgi:putative membrane protein